MKPGDMGPILAMVEREERHKWRREQEAGLKHACDRMFPTPRAVRARHFAFQIISLLSKHIPEACHDEAIQELMVNAYGHDWEIVSVPPERDAEYEAALKAAEVGLAPGFVTKD